MFEMFFRNGTFDVSGAHSLLDKGMMQTHQATHDIVSLGKRTITAVNQADALPAVVSDAVHKIEQPVMNLLRDSDRAAVAVTQSSNTGQMAIQLLGFGALGWMGWNLFAYLEPRKHSRLTAELQRTAKRIRADW